MHEIAGDAMVGSYWVYHLSFDDPMLEPLKAKFEKRFGAAPTEVVNTVAAYDIIYWIADAIKRAGKAEGEAVRDAIEDTKDLKPSTSSHGGQGDSHSAQQAGAYFAVQGRLRKFREMYAPQSSSNPGRIFFKDTTAKGRLFSEGALLPCVRFFAVWVSVL
jgi:branched-chain amino acid transport system substrate-binding protein